MFQVTFLSKSLTLIGCQGNKHGKFFKKMLKILLLKNHKLNEADTLHTS